MSPSIEQRCAVCDKPLGTTHWPAQNHLPAMCLQHGPRVDMLVRSALEKSERAKRPSRRQVAR